MLTPHDRQRARFRIGDLVSFSFQRKTHEGKIIRLNPKRSIIESAKGRVTVPYALLHPMSGQCEKRIRHLERIQALAESLLSKHGLKSWSFQFDHSTRRAGSCSYRQKRITLAFELAVTGTEQDIRETLLHEIAHALVGRNHHHDAVWKAKAREIGCSGARTHTLQFSTPRWAVTCGNRCWTSTAQQRNSKLICRKCGSKLVYTPYSAPEADLN